MLMLGLTYAGSGKVKYWLKVKIRKAAAASYPRPQGLAMSAKCQERTIAPSVFWSAQLALRKSGSRPSQGLVRATKLYACVAYPAFFPLKNALYAELLRYPSRN